MGVKAYRMDFLLATILLLLGCLDGVAGAAEETADRKMCQPYTESACRLAASINKYQVGGNGYQFAGDYTTKGCYVYVNGPFNGRVYYGTGGTLGQKMAPLAGPTSRRHVVRPPWMKKSLEKKVRPKGYDCSIDFSRRSL